MDGTVRLWDLVAGRAASVLTNHKKAVRALTLHPSEYTFASASADNMKKWKCPEGEFMQNMSGHNTIIHALAVNEDGVLFSGGDNGTYRLWDWKTGYNFQSDQTVVQPGRCALFPIVSLVHTRPTNQPPPLPLQLGERSGHL
mgnify:CR=1 FL=1